MQLKLGSFKEVLTGIDDINQEIMLILTTPLGSIPHRPEFGSKIYEYLDKPVNMAKPLIIAESFRALRTNSDRFYPTNITANGLDFSTIAFKITGYLTNDEDKNEIELEFLADFTKAGKS